MVALLILIIYVVVYLAAITRRKTPPAIAEADAIAPPQADPGDLVPDWTPRLLALIWPH
jgi:hypothetical protein